jgi:hypothetical protein
LAARRDHPTINQFLSIYVDVDQTGPLTVGVLPLGYEGPIHDLPLEQWDEVELHDLQELVALVISEPARAFTVYLPSPSPWSGAILCCARTGEITYGVSVDDPDDRPEARSAAADLLRRLCETTGGARGWAVWEEPPSVDPRTDRPWELTSAVAHFAPGK